MSCRCDGLDDEDDNRMFDSNGCFHCPDRERVRGRFGLAWVSETPESPYPEPVGWQVEFHDTPSRVETKCQEMVRWINCPPLPRCDPCPPDELCSPNNPPRCNPCAPMTNPCHPPCKSRAGGGGSSSPPRQPSTTKRCCCCCGGSGGGGRQKGRGFAQSGLPYCSRKRSPRRRGGGGGNDNLPKCTCDDVPVKDTNISSSGDYMHANRKYQNYTSTSPQQAHGEREGAAAAAAGADTITLYHNDKPYQTDTDDRSVQLASDGGQQDAGRNTNDKKNKKQKSITAGHRELRVNHLRNNYIAYGQADNMPNYACDECCEKFMQLKNKRSFICHCYDDEDEKDDKQEKASDDTTFYSAEDKEAQPPKDKPKTKDDGPKKKPDDKPKRQSSIDSLDAALMKMSKQQKKTVFAERARHPAGQDHAYDHDSIDESVVEKPPPEKPASDKPAPDKPPPPRTPPPRTPVPIKPPPAKDHALATVEEASEKEISEKQITTTTTQSRNRSPHRGDESRSRHKSRPLRWLSPCIYNLCFRTRESKSKDKKLKPKQG